MWLKFIIQRSVFSFLLNLLTELALNKFLLQNLLCLFLSFVFHLPKSSKLFFRWYREWIFQFFCCCYLKRWWDGYVGLQLIHAGQTYYGWVRMDVNVTAGSASMTIKDYAYNSIPNQPILAGQTTATGIIENYLASSEIFFQILPLINWQLRMDNWKLKV